MKPVRAWTGFVDDKIYKASVYMKKKEAEEDYEDVRPVLITEDKPCVWTWKNNEDTPYDDDGCWLLGCKNNIGTFFCEKDVPTHNGYKFCPYCGHRIEVKK